MLPKYSFKLKPTKRSLPKEKPFTHTLGEYIRFERVKRHIKQETLAKQFGVNGVATPLTPNCFASVSCLI